MHIRGFLAAVFTLTILNAADAEIVITRAVAKDVGKTYGFYLGQSYSLKRITKEYAELAGGALIAETEFTAAFGDSIREMDRRMTDIRKYDWAMIKDQLREKVTSTTENFELSRLVANEFVNSVRARAKGEIPSPFLEILLLFKPTYQRSPLLEFADGYKKTYSSEGSAKARNLKVTFEYPSSWEGSAGKRPNTLVLVTSELGRGLEICNLVIKELSLPADYVPTEAEIDELFQEPAIRDLVPKGAIYQDGGPTKMEGLSAAWIVYKHDVERAGQRALIKMITYSTFYENKFVQLGCMVGVDSNKVEAQLEEYFRKFQPLFQQIANSLVIHNRYQDAP